MERRGGSGVDEERGSLPPPSVGELASAHFAHSRWKMGILLVGTEHPFNNAHTLLDALCYHLRLDYTLKRNDSHALIPGRQMTAFCRGGSGADARTQSGDTCPPDRVLCVGSLPPPLPIGQFGEVLPEILTRWELFYPTSFIELDLDSITALRDIDKA